MKFWQKIKISFKVNGVTFLNIVIKILQCKLVTQIGLGGLTVYRPVTNFLRCIFAKNYFKMAESRKLLQWKRDAVFWSTLYRRNTEVQSVTLSTAWHSDWRVSYVACRLLNERIHQAQQSAVQFHTSNKLCWDRRCSLQQEQSKLSQKCCVRLLHVIANRDGEDDENTRNSLCFCAMCHQK